MRAEGERKRESVCVNGVVVAGGGLGQPRGVGVRRGRVSDRVAGAAGNFGATLVLVRLFFVMKFISQYGLD